MSVHRFAYVCTYIYSYMCVCVQTVLQNVCRTWWCYYMGLSSENMHYHHHMSVYQPLHRYEHFKVSLCQTVWCQLTVIHLHEYSQLWHRPRPRTPTTPSLYIWLAVQCNSVPGERLCSRLHVFQCCCVCVMKFPGANPKHPEMPFRVWILQRPCQSSRWWIVSSFRIKELQAYSLVFVTVTVCQIMSSNTLCCARKYISCSIRRTSRKTSASIKSVAYFISYWPLPYHV